MLGMARLEPDFDPVAAQRRGDRRHATRGTKPNRIGGQGRHHPSEHRSVGDHIGNVFWQHDVHHVVTGTKFVERSGHYLGDIHLTYSHIERTSPGPGHIVELVRQYADPVHRALQRVDRLAVPGYSGSRAQRRDGPLCGVDALGKGAAGGGGQRGSHALALGLLFGAGGAPAKPALAQILGDLRRACGENLQVSRR